MAGYSGTPLAKKLGIKPGSRLYTAGAPSNYAKLLAPLPDGVDIVSRPPTVIEFAHVFTTQRSDLATKLRSALDATNRRIA